LITNASKNTLTGEQSGELGWGALTLHLVSSRTTQFRTMLPNLASIEIRVDSKTSLVKAS
jgi:hypothetical protein